MKQPEKQLHIFLALLSLLLASCSSEQSSSTTHHIDSAKVIEAGISYLYKSRSFAPEAYIMPIKIIDSPNVPKHLNFMMNGKKCEIVTRPPDTDYHKNFQNPIPYIDVTKLKLTERETVSLHLSFPSTGTEYFLRVKKDACGIFQVNLITYSKT